QYLKQKRELAEYYSEFFKGTDFKFVTEPDYAQSNYWLNAIICPDKESREEVLTSTNSSGVMTRPIWQLMHRLPMFENAIRGDLAHSEFI
ncbi:DegT/DnrJ/EryC1/StrS family aminotransferase, partial [Escherichia coli]|nr:DegT/DnrJ/EryC1/StrS family aminotransferase [Escherichia coli]